MTQARTYFAATNRKEVGSALGKRLEQWTSDRKRTNLDEQMSAYRAYYGKENGAGITYGVSRAGTQGELAAVRINRARALAKALLAIITGPKLTWRPTARNDDASSLRATSLSAVILEDFWKTRHLSRQMFMLVEIAIAFSQGAQFIEWDPSAGPAFAPLPNGRLMKQGDITIHNVLPWDMRVDNSLKSASAANSWFVCIPKNRFDLAASTVRLADGRNGDEAEQAILSANTVEAYQLDGTRRMSDDSTDQVPVWYFFHKPTAALPLGREVCFLNPDVVLHDRNLKVVYDGEVPLVRLAADEMFDSPHAWTSFWDTLGAQEVLDAVDTALATIVTTLGEPVVAYQMGTQAAPDILPGGMRTWPYPQGSRPPESVQLGVFPPDALKYKDVVQQDQRQMMGLNDVALGQPQTAQMNAQAFAVLASMAVQQANPFQTSYLEAVGRAGTIILKTLAKNVTRDRMVKVAGKTAEGLYTTTKYKGSDLSPVDGVNVDIGNPMEQMPGGRLALLQQYMQIPGAVTEPEQAIQVIETGRLEPAIRGQRDELMHLNWEREQLLSGVNPPVHPLQNHGLHFKNNGSIVHNEAALKSAQVLGALEQHLDMHYAAMYGVDRKADPMRHIRESFLLGRPPDPTLAQTAMPPPGAGGPPGGPPPPDGPPNGPPPPGGPPPPNASQVLSPELATATAAPPTNPMTGQPFELATGGSVVPA